MQTAHPTATPTRSPRRQDQPTQQLAFLPPEHEPDSPSPDRRKRFFVMLAAELLFALVVGIPLLRADTWQETKDVLIVTLPVMALAAGVGIGLALGRRTR